MNEIFQNNEILQGPQKFFSPLLTSPDLVSPPLKSSNQRYFLRILQTSAITSTIERMHSWLVNGRCSWLTGILQLPLAPQAALTQPFCILYFVF